jgi:hypothetical protein
MPKMTLLEVVGDLESFDKTSTIYAARPWTTDSPAIVALEPDAGGVPAEAQKLGLAYFLEVFVAREFLEGWVKNLGAEPTSQEKCARVIRYARDDA